MPHFNDDHTLVLALRTDDGQVHRFNLHEDEEPGDIENIDSAFVYQFDANGEPVDSYPMDSNDWEAIQNNGEVSYLWFWVRRGVELGTAVDVCVEGCDPEGYDHEYEQSIDDYIAEVDTLKAALQSMIEVSTKFGDALHHLACNTPGQAGRDLSTQWCEGQKVIEAAKKVLA